VYRQDLGLGAGEMEGGVVVWAGIPDPMTLSTELVRGNATLCAGECQPHAEAHVLGAWQNSHLELGPVQRRNKSKATVLQLELCNAHLMGALHPHLIQRVDESDPEKVYAHLMERMAQLYPTFDRPAALDALLAREREVPSVLGGGIVVPHVYHPSAPSRMCAIAQVPPGLALVPPDGLPIRLVFLLVSPEDDAEGHLATLGEVVRVVTSHETREHLLEARTATEALELIRKTLRG
jgi:mannitol/fructose-specific phosphotransferase system IIA component (Ntr-type)